MQKTVRSGSAPQTRGSEMPATVLSPGRTRSETHGMPPISPTKNSKRLKDIADNVNTLAEGCSIAMSRTESVLVSATGDVMVSRCRRSSTPYLSNVPGVSQPNMQCWESDFGSMSDFMSTIDVPWSNKLMNGQEYIPHDNESVLSGVSSYEWEKLDKQIMKKKKNVSKADTKPKPKTQRAVTEPPAKSSPQGESGVELVFSSMPSQSPNSSDTVGIISMPSFDYSHIHEGNNDMIPPNLRMCKSPRGISTIHESPFEEKKDENDGPAAEVQPFFHGVPVFLSSLSQIQITKVSANPLGAHVLMISAEALLLTYGLNNHGQLGIGIKSSLRDGSRGFVTSPTLVTPLLENGGKTINCAAGIDHSLVVVSTEGRRLQKIKKNHTDHHSEGGSVPLKRQTSSPSKFEAKHDDDDTSDESVQHHQVYGFGHNDFMKVGLINAALDGESDMANEDEDILLPHRVALHCTVWPEDNPSSSGSRPPQGIFDIAASAEHSAALMRRPTGDVEVYMWGNASMGALGKFETDEELVVRGEIGKRPESNVESVFPHPTLIEHLTDTKKDSPLGFPVSLALGPYCSFVLMSDGSCMSFGFSAEGMLGQGFGMTHTTEPREIFVPQLGNSEASNKVVAISTGACHVLCITADGGTWSWGVDKDGRLGLHVDDFSGYGQAEDAAQTLAIEWVPQRIGIKQHASRTFCGSADDSKACLKVCAGYDSSMLLMRSGQVLSFGKKSGRLGKGEVDADVVDPQPVNGGLCLFHHGDEGSQGKVNTKVPPIPSRNYILRAHSDL